MFVVCVKKNFPSQTITTIIRFFWRAYTSQSLNLAGAFAALATCRARNWLPRAITCKRAILLKQIFIVNISITSSSQHVVCWRHHLNTWSDDVIEGNTKVFNFTELHQREILNRSFLNCFVQQFCCKLNKIFHVKYQNNPKSNLITLNFHCLIIINIDY